MMINNTLIEGINKHYGWGGGLFISIAKLTKYPTIGANIVSVKAAVPMIIPISSEEAPLSSAYI